MPADSDTTGARDTPGHPRRDDLDRDADEDRDDGLDWEDDSEVDVEDDVEDDDRRVGFGDDDGLE